MRVCGDGSSASGSCSEMQPTQRALHFGETGSAASPRSRKTFCAVKQPYSREQSATWRGRDCPDRLRSRRSRIASSSPSRKRARLPIFAFVGLHCGNVELVVDDAGERVAEQRQGGAPRSLRIRGHEQTRVSGGQHRRRARYAATPGRASVSGAAARKNHRHGAGRRRNQFVAARVRVRCRRRPAACSVRRSRCGPSRRSTRARSRLSARRAKLDPQFRVENAHGRPGKERVRAAVPLDASRPPGTNDVDRRRKPTPRSIATAHATAPVPHAIVMPTPRSQCRTRSASPSTAAKCTFVPFGKSGIVLKRDRRSSTVRSVHDLLRRARRADCRDRRTVRRRVYGSDSRRLRGDPIATRTRYSGSRATTASATMPASVSTTNGVALACFVEPASRAAHAVSAHLGLAAVGVDDAHPHVGAGRRFEHDQPSAPTPAWRSHSPAAERRRTSTGLRVEVDDHEVVARPVHLRDGYRAFLAAFVFDGGGGNAVCRGDCNRSPRRDRRDRVLVDQMRLALVFEQHRKRIEAFDDAAQLEAVHEKHGHRRALALGIRRETRLEDCRRMFMMAFAGHPSFSRAAAAMRSARKPQRRRARRETTHAGASQSGASRVSSEARNSARVHQPRRYASACG